MPVIVIVELPAGVVAAVVTLSIALPAPLTAAGVNDAVASSGSPVALRFTAPAKPFSAPI